MPEAAKIYVGTSGWSYPKGEGTWSGYFYPDGTKNELEYYSQFFNTVEINTSFYGPPNPEFARKWAKRTPDDFLFTLKLWQKFTHPRMFTEATGEEALISQADVDLFRRSLEPLAAAGKLGALLAQFPPSFKNDEFGRQILGAVGKTFGQYRVAVELRHKSWSDDKSITALLQEGNLAWVQIDEPKFASSIAAELPVTADTAYFRLHGRNAGAWWSGNNETRYKYLYSSAEIDELGGKIKAVAGRTRLLFAMFNNHWQGYAPRNASDLKKALGVPSNELPVQDITGVQNKLL